MTEPELRGDSTKLNEKVTKENNQEDASDKSGSFTALPLFPSLAAVFPGDPGEGLTCCILNAEAI